MSEKNCINCKHFFFSTCDYGYSEWTPGWEADISCDVGKWDLDLFNDTTDDYRRYMLMANKCEQYKHYKEMSNDK